MASVLSGFEQLIITLYGNCVERELDKGCRIGA
jgi:hypothetical protein